MVTSFAAKIRCLLLATAISLVLVPYVHAEATHTGVFNFSGAGSPLVIYQNQTGDIHSVFVTVCVNSGGPVNVVGPFATFGIGLGVCRSSSVELNPNTAIGLNISGAVTTTGTYQVSTIVGPK